MPAVVWVWDMSKLYLIILLDKRESKMQLAAALQHLHPVKSFKFAPHSQQLYIGTGQSRVFMWSPKGACVIDLPRNEFAANGPNAVNVHRILWNPKGTNMVFTDRNVAILGFPLQEISQPTSG